MTIPMSLIAIVLAGTGAAAQRRWLLPLLAVAFLLLVPMQLRGWNLFHYWLGSRYAAQLGYDGLYECTAVPLGAEYARDLATYNIVSVRALDGCPAASQPAIQNDLNWLRSVANVPPNVVADKGLNGTPPWLAIASRLATLPPGSLAWRLVVYSDPILIVAALLLAAHWLGHERAIYAGLVIISYWGTLGRLGGNWLQYPWLALLIVAAAALASQRQAIAGAALAASASLAAFPVVLFLYPAVDLLRAKGSRRIGRPFWLAAGLAGLAMCLLGLASPAGWLPWLADIRLHGSYLVLEPGNIGLNNLLVAITDPGRARAAWMALAGHWAFAGQPGTIQPSIPLALGLGLQSISALLLIVWSFWHIVTHRRGGFYMVLPVVFAALTLSRYYWIMLAVAALEIGRPAARTVLLASAAILMAQALLEPLYAGIGANIITMTTIVILVRVEHHADPI